MFSMKILRAAGIASALVAADAFSVPVMGLRKSVSPSLRRAAAPAEPLRIRGGNGLKMSSYLDNINVMKMSAGEFKTSTETLPRGAGSPFPDSAPSTTKITPANAGLCLCALCMCTHIPVSWVAAKLRGRVYRCCSAW